MVCWSEKHVLLCLLLLKGGGQSMIGGRAGRFHPEQRMPNRQLRCSRCNSRLSDGAHTCLVECKGSRFEQGGGCEFHILILKQFGYLVRPTGKRCRLTEKGN